ncbi:hypothetical protein TSMEX_001445 [Taenia solium]|eukprot:TsM_000268300 transcript=TsM_000268300 gene=TsM_000268300
MPCFTLKGVSGRYTPLSLVGALRVAHRSPLGVQSYHNCSNVPLSARSLMDPIFEPIFDFSENMAGFPFSFSKPQTYWDEVIHREPEFGTSRIFRDIFGDISPFSTELFPDNLPKPYWMTPGYITPAHPRRNYVPFPNDLFSENFLKPFWMTPGYVTPAHPRRDYILDQESGPSSSYSFSSSTYSSDSNGQRCETIKASVRQPDGVVINKEIIRKDGREVTTTTTIHPDGRHESKTETSEGMLTDVPPVFVPSAEDIFKEDGVLNNLRRWFGL